MRQVRLAVLMLALTGETLAADGIVIRGNDAMSGTVYDFGGIKPYQDSRGTTGRSDDFGRTSTNQFTSPDGRHSSGSISSLGTASNLGVVPEPVTPAPVLPFGPHLSPLLAPGEPKVPAIAPPSAGNLGTAFWKR
jgi:hypothetical protein